MAFGVVALEVEDVAQVGAAPRVDALVVVADDGQVLALAGEQADPQVLGAVGVLVLVDVQVAPAILVVRQHAGRLLEQPHGLVEQVVEVERAGRLEARLVRPIRAGGDLLLVAARSGLRCVGADQVVLPAADLASSTCGRSSLVLQQVEIAHDQLDRARLIVRVVDREARVDADRGAVAAQDARAQRVERAHGHVARLLADEREDARAHLGRGLVGERDREDLPRLDALDADEVRDAMGEHARLAAARAGQDQQRPFGRGDGARLLGVEPRDDVSGERLALGGRLLRRGRLRAGDVE